MSSRTKKLLVYIPTHTDFKQAVEQSRKIKTCAFLADLEIKTVISVNGVELSSEEIRQIEDSCDELICHRENLGGDLNINLGYLRALLENVDFYWVLSANDELNANSIESLLEKIIKLDADMLIIGYKNSKHTGILNNAFQGEGNLLPIGLISSTIYQTHKFKRSFANSLKFSWTGWGQLSVIQNSIFEFGSLSYELVEEDKIYNRTAKTSISEQLRINQSSYRHSFFGYPLVVALLFSQDKSLQNKIIRKWLSTNWYKIGFFRGGKSSYVEHNGTGYDVYWTERLSRGLILHSGVFSPVLYAIGNLTFIYKLHRIPFFQAVKKRIVLKNYLEQR
jgi:hypothetical protein